MKNRKLLVLTPRFPYPVIGGDRLRIYEVCKALSKEYELTLLSLCETKEEMSMALPNDGIFTRVERIYLPKWQSFLNCLFALPTRTPLQVAYYRSGKFRASFKKLASMHDVVFCHLIRTTEYAVGSGLPLIVEFTDAISLNYLRVKKLSKRRNAKGRIYSLEQSRLEAYEKSVGQKSKLNVFVSSYDANYLFPPGTEASHRTLVCSNGVDVSAYPFVRNRRSREIAFIGNMFSVQNMDAALWFAEEVMPLLIDDGFTFKVVGRISNANKARLNKYQGVDATGSVESIVEAVSTSFLGVCPMRIGAGVQNKILEYMALGLPCITSSLGLEGLQAEPDKELFVSDNASDIAAKVKDLFHDVDMHSRISQNARFYVETNHSWSAKLRPLVASVEEVIKFAVTVAT